MMMTEEDAVSYHIRHDVSYHFKAVITSMLHHKDEISTCSICSLKNVTSKEYNCEYHDELILNIQKLNELQNNNKTLKLQIQTLVLNDNSLNTKILRDMQYHNLIKVREEKRLSVDKLNLKINSDVLFINNSNEYIAYMKEHERKKNEYFESSQIIKNDLKTYFKKHCQILYLERLSLAVKVLTWMNITLYNNSNESNKNLSDPFHQHNNDNYKDDSIDCNSNNQSNITICMVNNVKIVTGYTSILNIPIPNNGYYKDVPVDIIILGLTHIVYAIDILSVILNTILPHPIILHEYPNGCDLIDSNHISAIIYTLNPIKSNIILDTKNDIEYKGLYKMTLHELENINININGHICNIINPCFYQALSLLQENIILLCANLGIRTNNLYPSEALLLNLNILLDYMNNKVNKNNEIFQESLNDNQLDIFENYQTIYQKFYDIKNDLKLDMYYINSNTL